MRNLLFFLLSFGFCGNLFSQTSVTEYSDSAYVLPDSLCVTCTGSVWQNPMSIISRAFLLPFNECNQDTCYYTREFRFCSYGFNIPPDASIDSFLVFVTQGASAEHAVVDTIVQLMKNHIPVGNNCAYPYPWLPNQYVYYPGGLFGTTWTPQDVNDPGFGLMLRVKNISNDTVSARMIDSHIRVWYSTTSGVFSQTSKQNTVRVYPNPSKESFNIQLEKPIYGCEIRLTDLTGNVILQKKIGNETRIKIDSLPVGTYILTISGYDINEIKTKIISY